MPQHSFDEEMIQDLYRAFVKIDNAEDCAAFLEDLCTRKEVEQMAQRLRAARLLAEGMRSFRLRCADGIRANREKMAENLRRSLMLVTALSPTIGYEAAAETAKLAHREDLTLREACLRLGYLTGEQFDALFHPEEMV